MDPYPVSLSNQQNGHEQSTLKPPVEESGQHTPSHGGMVTGMEYDMAIAARTGNRDASPLRPAHTTNGDISATPSVALEPPTEPKADVQTSTTAESSAVPIPRPSPTNGSARRPVSMPPQPNVSGTSSAGGESRSRNHEPQHRSKQSGRVLGSYTMTKTLGAGSMGKVKLAVHNQTGEKVCCLVVNVFFPRYLRMWFVSSRSKSCPGRLFFPLTTMIQTHHPRLPHSLQSKMQRKFRKKSAPFVKPHSPCYCITLIYAGCAS